MADMLVFTLSATLGAMGEFAGHERRGSLAWPGRSAILGLIGAAMGIRRNGDFSALDDLGMAVAIFDAGTPLRDYHTAQTVPSAAVKHPQSRPEALRRGRTRLNTVLTSRDYRMAPLYGVALWDGPLDEIKAALERPVFQLYLGRKSCPLSAPLAPRRIEAGELEDALAQLRLPPWREGAVARQLVADEGTLQGAVTERRNDMPLDRELWHFGPRQVSIAPVEIRPAPHAEAAP
ncbi:type I-E CRISPR-associated protein Cas5/CasD [Marivita sp. GX14005]|uniref:type I-E CRISPR-associated protein Cas5/CasD n=1 Tax=Marivita sp. GX14005 TaxID=2942276 RepID=UPI002019A24E|nr:type I-E CRISPR-associated protein Cas5/CasD [Marivita sp. GX14005]MCL3883007.1 type I-E CRISPR-associated protein Cas5/CasD [Marivita sp. GX14005]